MTKPLPPLPKDAFDGETESAEIPAQSPIPSCPSNHKTVSFDRAKNELRCTCGAAWTGYGLETLYKTLTGQSA